MQYSENAGRERERESERDRQTVREREKRKAGKMMLPVLARYVVLLL